MLWEIRSFGNLKAGGRFSVLLTGSTLTLSLRYRSDCKKENKIRFRNKSCDGCWNVNTQMLVSFSSICLWMVLQTLIIPGLITGCFSHFTVLHFNQGSCLPTYYPTIYRPTYQPIIYQSTYWPFYWPSYQLTYLPANQDTNWPTYQLTYPQSNLPAHYSTYWVTYLPTDLPTS